MGDPSGIGPEVVAAALARPIVARALVPVVFGDGPMLRAHRVFRQFGICSPGEPLAPGEATVCVVTQLNRRDVRPGKPTRHGAIAQWRYLEEAIACAKRGELDALCTAPVSKEQIARAGIPFTGHTEVLAKSFARDVLMLMDGPRLRVALATNHLPLAQVPRALSPAKLVAQLQLLARSLRVLLRRAPRIAVCGLNPHAGDGGLLGREELTIIRPAIQRARRRGVKCEGPFAADGLFARASRMRFDVVLAMFHDQGLVATKTLDFERTVNVTLGLPLPRTSPDHGVAYGLAGKNLASAEPMVHALLKAAELAPKYRV